MAARCSRRYENPSYMTIHPYYDFVEECLEWVMIPIPIQFLMAVLENGSMIHSCPTDTLPKHNLWNWKIYPLQDKGLGEQTGIQAVVDWLGEQNWSNGNVGLMGKSYVVTSGSCTTTFRPFENNCSNFGLHRSKKCSEMNR